jgi:predicted RNA-binding protein with PUA-like domain
VGPVISHSRFPTTAKPTKKRRKKEDVAVYLYVRKESTMAGVSGERSSSWSDSARSDSDDNYEDIDSAIADARTALVRCEQEMALIKSALRNLGQPSTSEEENTLVIKWIKVCD